MSKWENLGPDVFRSMKIFWTGRIAGEGKSKIGHFLHRAILVVFSVQYGLYYDVNAVLWRYFPHKSLVRVFRIGPVCQYNTFGMGPHMPLELIWNLLGVAGNSTRCGTAGTGTSRGTFSDSARSW